LALAVAARDRGAALTFQAPTDNGGSAVTGYEVSTDNGGSWSALSPASGANGVLTASVGNLANDTAYQVRVRAVTAAGPGAGTTAVAVTPLAPPAAPTGVVATARTATITVSWVAPANGGAPVTGYTAFASPGPATCDTDGATTCVLGAQANQPYTVTVVAHSASGDSVASAPSSSATAAPPVIPPTPPVTSEKLETPKDADDTTRPGETITIRGSGYAPNSTVEIVVYSAPVSLGTVVTDSNGEFSVDVVVPPKLVGTHSIVAQGADPDGNVRSMRLDVTVAPKSASPSKSKSTSGLAVTGDATAGTATVGLLLLLVGAGLVRASRGRRPRPGAHHRL